MEFLTSSSAMELFFYKNEHLQHNTLAKVVNMEHSLLASINSNKLDLKCANYLCEEGNSFS